MSMLSHMRTTLRIDDTLFRRAKAHAARTGRTLTSLVQDALRALLDRKPTAVDSPGRVRLPTDGRGGTRPGVNLDSNAELLELLDGADGPR